jgi:uncharacterized protein (TIGR03086 family)
MPDLDLRPAAQRMARLLEGVSDDALAAPTPCDDLPLSGLIGHVGGFATGFIAAAKKDVGEQTAPPASGPPPLEPGWRDQVAADLAALADAWDAPAAWEGMTQAGGVDLPGPVAGRVALDELVIHGWDIATATGQPFDPDESELREIEATVRQLRGDQTGEIPGLFGPLVPVPDDAPLLHQVLGLTGRDPAWTPTG